MFSTVRSITVGGGGGTICTVFDDVDLGDVDVVATLVVDAVNTCRLDRLVRLKSFSPMTSGIVAHCNLCCCTDVVVAVVAVVVLEVAVLEVAMVTLDAVVVLVADAAGRDRIS